MTSGDLRNEAYLRIDEIFHSKRDKEKNYKLHFLSLNNVFFK
jgi:hypothetical protein